MSMRICILVAATMLVPAATPAQRLPPVPSYSSSAFRFHTTKAIPKTYWLEGGIVGGVGLGVFTVLLFEGMSEGSHLNVAGYALTFLAGASVGFPVGALIGGQFHK